MKGKPILAVCLVSIVLFFGPALSDAREMGAIQLLPPQTEGGKPLMQALKERKSVREFGDRELPLQVISNLLWAADGINRPDSGFRTAPSSRNMQEIDIYVATAEGLYLFDAKANMLVPVLAQDIRGSTGKQSFVENAPLNLIFVADHAKMSNLTADEKDFYSATDTGFISQNVYLFCASEGLVTVVRGLINKLSLTRAMKLRPGQTIILAQTVGYPKE